jgi:hypothetical protein
MPSRAIEEFARKLVTSVRDRTIQSCDANLRPTAQNVVAKRWREAGAGKEQEVTIPDTVDEALFFLLYAIDDGLLRLTYTTDDGETVDLSEAGLGELAGWYVGPDSWLDRYSSERRFQFGPDEDSP